MDFQAIFTVFTTVINLVGGAVDAVIPIVKNIVGTSRELKPTTQPHATINPNCESPTCGTAPNYCPDNQLSPICVHQRMAANDAKYRPRTTESSKKDDDDDKENSSTSMSKSSIIILAIVGVIALAIIGFLFMRFNQQNNRQNSISRKSSTWSV